MNLRRIDGICDFNRAGQYLRMGDYGKQGGQGGTGLIDGLEGGERLVAIEPFDMLFDLHLFL